MTKVYVIGDAHDSPRLRKDRFGWIGRDIRKESPDVLVQIGDFASLDSLGTYEANDSYSGKFKPLFAADVASFRLANVGLDAASKFRGDKRFTYGNHEHRIARYAERNPEVYGLVQSEFDGAVDEFGWKRYEYGDITYVDKVGFTHVPFTTMGRPYGGKTAAYRVAADSACDLVYGHDHRAGVVRSPRIGGGSNTIVNVGCALPWGHVEPYAKHSTTGWWWGTVVLTIYRGKVTDWDFRSMRRLKHG